MSEMIEMSILRLMDEKNDVMSLTLQTEELRTKISTKRARARGPAKSKSSRQQKSKSRDRNKDIYYPVPSSAVLIISGRVRG